MMRVVFPFNLGSSRCEDIDVKLTLQTVGATGGTVASRSSVVHQGSNGSSRSIGEGMRWRDIGRTNVGTRCRTRNGLWWRWHHMGHGSWLIQDTIIDSSSGSNLCSSMFVPSSRVGVIVYPRMPSQFVRPAKSFGTTRKLACVWFFACMSPNVSRLMLQSVKRLVAHGTFVRTWKFLSWLITRGV